MNEKYPSKDPRSLTSAQPGPMGAFFRTTYAKNPENIQYLEWVQIYRDSTKGVK
jgi:hypothetical protein